MMTMASFLATDISTIQKVEKWMSKVFVCGWDRGKEELMGVGCPCPPVRNDIVTPRHFFFERHGSFNFLVFVQSPSLRPSSEPRPESKVQTNFNACAKSRKGEFWIFLSFLTVNYWINHIFDDYPMAVGTLDFKTNFYHIPGRGRRGRRGVPYIHAAILIRREGCA